MSSLDGARYREVLGHYLTGVVVVTASSPDGPAGFTCQAFGSLSVDEQLIYFAASVTSVSWGRIREVGVVGLSILSDGQEPLARVFAVTGTDKFAGVAWHEGPRGTPLLDGALVSLEGTIVEVTNHGDHDIVIVKIATAVTSEGAPLAYYRGGYRVLA